MDWKSWRIYAGNRGLLPFPVIVITSDDQPETRHRVLKGGATAILIKPATLDALEGALKGSQYPVTCVVMADKPVFFPVYFLGSTLMPGKNTEN
jgi:CheY-like chemotaxis protein